MRSAPPSQAKKQALAQMARCHRDPATHAPFRLPIVGVTGGRFSRQVIVTGFTADLHAFIDLSSIEFSTRSPRNGRFARTIYQFCERLPV